MPAQKAAVEPLPLEPVTATEMRCNLARSTARASSRSAIRARQTPSPYFGRLNTQQSHRGKCVMPDLQDQIATTRFLQQPDRRIGVQLDHPYSIRLSAELREHVHRGDAKSERMNGLPCQCERGIGTDRKSTRLNSSHANI